MLLKRVCPQCGHHYLADEQLDEIDCPRCHAPVDEGPQFGAGAPPLGSPGGVQPVQPRQPFGGGAATSLREPRFSDQYGTEAEVDDFAATTFDPLAPPPMFVTGDRVLRGILAGSLATLAIGSVAGAALSAIGFTIPLAPTLLLGWIAGLSCKRAFGGRAAKGTRGRAFLVVLVSLLFGYVGVLGGSYLVERLVGARVEQTRDDFDRGLKNLTRQRGHVTDEGTSILLDQRIAKVKELQALSSPQVEDYLWVQEAQIRQPLVAYMKLRVTRGPVLDLGPDREPVTIKRELTMAAIGGELLIAALLAMALVAPRRP